MLRLANLEHRRVAGDGERAYYAYIAGCQTFRGQSGTPTRLQMPEVPAAYSSSRSDVLFLWPHPLPPVEQKLEN
eukprot:4422135-Pleurochrysis_carterae.AAC.1